MKNLGLVIGLVLGALIALGFVATTVILYIRKNKLKNAKKGANGNPVAPTIGKVFINALFRLFWGQFSANSTQLELPVF